MSKGYYTQIRPSSFLMFIAWHTHALRGILCIWFLFYFIHLLKFRYTVSYIHRPNFQTRAKQQTKTCFVFHFYGKGSKSPMECWTSAIFHDAPFFTTRHSQGKGQLVDHGFGSFKFHAKEPGVSGKIFRLQCVWCFFWVRRGRGGGWYFK